MTVGELFEGTAASVPAGLAARSIAGLSLDSRKVKPGDLFFALAGKQGGELDHAREACARGAVGVVAAQVLADIPCVLVHDGRGALALAAARFFHHPDRRVRLLGITGTNGKTTTALLIAAAIEAAGERSGFIGTLGIRSGNAWQPTVLTTPEAPDLCAALDLMARDGVRSCAMEVSSHALSQERVAGLRFAAAGFTNLTRDHLDYHGDLEAYFATKRRLFSELLESSARAVVNVDGAFGDRLARELETYGQSVWRVGRDRKCDVHIAEERLDLAGTGLRLATPLGELGLRSPLVGAHNAENLALAAGMALSVGLPAASVERGLSALAAVPGRLERVEASSGETSGGGPLCFVDYAHTDDALSRVLWALRTLGVSGDRRLVVVFGCGGDRDPGKRPLMGRAAAVGADVSIVTSDNPRTENPETILAQIVPGLTAAGARPLALPADRAARGVYAVRVDRKAAIELALALARPEDVVLVAGKGHETTQTIGAEQLPFDDRVELQRALRGRAA